MSSILIIDDSPEDREQFSYLLQQAEPTVTVTTSAGGQDGVALAQEQSFDCVLLDLRLDGEDGLDVLAELQELRPNLPVIVFTGQGNERIAADAFVSGASYYLPKHDLTTKTLWTAIARVVQQAEAQRELQSKREAMERSNRLDAVGQLAAGIAHDLNNQLGALRYCLELLTSSAVTERAQGQVRTALKIIDESASLATRMVALSRQGDLLAKDVSLRDVFADLRALTSGTVSNQVMLKVHEPEADLLAYCDPGQLLNAILNLVLNADDAITAKGEKGTVSVSAVRDADKVRILVKDDGIGMSEDVISHCIDPFFTTKQNRNGTGLGLSMVQGLANETGGELLISSTEGLGTELELILPAGTEAEAPKKADETNPHISSERAHVLVVEDQFMLASMTKEILEQADFSVAIVPDGETALELMAFGQPVDLVITDIKMPTMNGFELARRVNQYHPPTKIIYVTGYSENHDHKEQELLGPILQKPVAPNDLIATINKVLAER